MRPHVVVLAYVCEPGAGSEEGAGWTWTKAASSIADVTLVTFSFGAQGVRETVAREGLPVEVVVVRAPAVFSFMSRRKWGGFIYYVIWQRSAARALRRIERERPVDVVHHVTWASDSLPTALRVSRAPVRVWGPVGGTTGTALGLYRYMTWQGRFDQLLRGLVNGTFRRVAADRVGRHATVVVAMNHDVERRFRRVPGRIVIHPNIALEQGDVAPPPAAAPVAPDGVGVAPVVAAGVAGDPDPGVRTAIFVGRLIPWKGLLLAIRTLAFTPGWRLVVYGEGPDAAPARRLIRKLGLVDSVTFRGRVPRDEVLRAYRDADALLFPSFHDSAPWSVGEASAAGCPVVCLDAGGPGLIAAGAGQVVPVEPALTLPQRIAECLRQIDGRCPPEDGWSVDRLPAVLSDWYGIPLAAAELTQRAAGSPA